ANYDAVSPATMSATLTINQIAYVLPETTVFNGLTTEYNGKEHEITVEGLPEGITATYADNKGTNAETYNAVATFVLGEELAVNYNAVEPATLNATLNITKKRISKADIDVIPSTVEYDGTVKTVQFVAAEGFSGIGEASDITFTSRETGELTTEPINVGTYDIRATFSEGQNYTGRSNFAVGAFTITPKTITVDDITVTVPEQAPYTGEAIEVSYELVEGVTADVTVTYTGEGLVDGKPVKVGTYAATIVVSGNGNYTGEETITKEFEIIKANQDAPAIELSKDEVKVTETAPELKLTNTPKENGVATYTVDKEGIISIAEDGTITLLEVGEVEITVTYPETDNYNSSFAKVTLNVTRDELDATDFDVTDNTKNYNETAQGATVSAKDDIKDGIGNITVKYYQNGIETTPIDAGEYDVVIDVEAGTKYGEIKGLTVGSLTINKIAYDLPASVKFNDDTVTYDGQAHEILVEGLPNGVTAKYVDNAGTDAGEYNAVATFELSEELSKNYSAVDPATMNAKLTINKVVYELPTTVVFNGLTTEYNGQNHEILVEGLPDGV
ncbi:MAG: hypothetical protein HFJ33_08160, partial [Clostridia bacterium]|nr:hypothetical protein [Clostridia bacterium]